MTLAEFGAELRMSRVTVLVVDDVPQVRATAVSILKQIGCSVLDTYSGEEALKLLEARPEIQVLLADVRMPGMTGTELAQEARRRRPDLSVILTSGYVGKEDLPQDLRFIPKPWRTESLSIVLESGDPRGATPPGKSRGGAH
jgi:CheY-like chemotaxis protein